MILALFLSFSSPGPSSSMARMCTKQYRLPLLPSHSPPGHNWLLRNFSIYSLSVCLFIHQHTTNPTVTVPPSPSSSSSLIPLPPFYRFQFLLFIFITISYIIFVLFSTLLICNEPIVLWFAFCEDLYYESYKYSILTEQVSLRMRTTEGPFLAHAYIYIRGVACFHGFRCPRWRKVKEQWITWQRSLRRTATFWTRRSLRPTSTI